MFRPRHEHQNTPAVTRMQPMSMGKWGVLWSEHSPDTLHQYLLLSACFERSWLCLIEKRLFFPRTVRGAGSHTRSYLQGHVHLGGVCTDNFCNFPTVGLTAEELPRAGELLGVLRHNRHQWLLMTPALGSAASKLGQHKCRYVCV